MNKHIPYHDMYSGPGESMGERCYSRAVRKNPKLESIKNMLDDAWNETQKSKEQVWDPKRDEVKIETVMKRDYGPFESGWDMGSRPLVWSDPFFITDTTIEYNTEDHEPLVWDREKTYKWVEII